MSAVQKAKNNKYILLNAPEEKVSDIINILPGMKSPTVLPLAEKDGVRCIPSSMKMIFGPSFKN